MVNKFTVGVLTSGGDAPGMNAAIRAVVRTALTNNLQVIGIQNGYEGLINGEFHPMDARSVGGILQRGGTILLTSRSKRFQEPAGQRDAIRKMNEAGMDALIVIGGEGSMNGAYALSQKGVKVIGIPGSIDNDIWGTNIAIGTDTAMNTIMEAVDKLRDTASSHQRAFVIETMGRNSGYLAVMAGIVCGAEMVLIPEVPVTGEEVAAAVEDAYQRGKTHAIIINAEGSAIRTTDLVEKIDTLDLGFKTRMTILGHIQRGGSPTAYDRLLASRMGVKAVEALVEGQHGVMTGLKGKGVDFIPLLDVISNKRKVNMEYYHMTKVLAR
ncbi:6-phosphofructokinase [Candidatus Villigracilis affinis]|jgi:6-phosphofructokinase 1|uniref:6-phosphofructokinase n=1 Tax=Candidatus Villigracilis affinis TaxID=3140682 RepID=UPI001D5B928C|nr:6-phosphofructokinase [Anaerolineales bacterium]MBL0347333.1 6-phosphofructokinase [Anaerolineales bacterium]